MSELDVYQRWLSTRLSVGDAAARIGVTAHHALTYMRDVLDIQTAGPRATETANLAAVDRFAREQHLPHTHRCSHLRCNGAGRYVTPVGHWCAFHYVNYHAVTKGDVIRLGPCPHLIPREYLNKLRLADWEAPPTGEEVPFLWATGCLVKKPVNAPARYHPALLTYLKESTRECNRLAA